MDEIRLFILPFAGGSTLSFRPLQAVLSEPIECFPVELPGRGTRSRERLVTNIHDLTDDVYAHVESMLGQSYAILGHSMGAILGYLLMRKIEANGGCLPLHFFASGHGGPVRAAHMRRYHLLPKQEFYRQIESFGGCPKEILQDEHSMAYFERILRSDFEAMSTFTYRPSAPLNVPIAVLVGSDTTYEDALLWQRETTIPISVHQHRGGHFFLFEHVREVGETIWKTLTGAKVPAR